jgi:hypothetical protein
MITLKVAMSGGLHPPLETAIENSHYFLVRNRTGLQARIMRRSR